MSSSLDMGEPHSVASGEIDPSLQDPWAISDLTGRASRRRLVQTTLHACLVEQFNEVAAKQ